MQGRERKEEDRKTSKPPTRKEKTTYSFIFRENVIHHLELTLCSVFMKKN